MARRYDLSKSGDRQRWVRDLQRNLQRDFEREAKRNPIRIPIEPESIPQARNVSSERTSPDLPLVQNNTYNGPVVHGDGASIQFASKISGDVNQNQEEQVADGFEQVAEVIGKVIVNLPQLGLKGDEAEELSEAANTVLRETTTEAPDRSVISRGINQIKGLLSAVALGVKEALTDSSKETSLELIKELTDASAII